MEYRLLHRDPECFRDAAVLPRPRETYAAVEDRKTIRSAIAAYGAAGVVAITYLVAELLGIESKSLDLFGPVGMPILAALPTYIIARTIQG